MRIKLQTLIEDQTTGAEFYRTLLVETKDISAVIDCGDGHCIVNVSGCEYYCKIEANKLINIKSSHIAYEFQISSN